MKYLTMTEFENLRFSITQETGDEYRVRLFGESKSPLYGLVYDPVSEKSFGESIDFTEEQLDIIHDEVLKFHNQCRIIPQNKAVFPSI